MKFKSGIVLLGIMLGFIAMAGAQKIVYSETDKDDSKQVDFEIMGKVGNNFQVYKKTRNRSYVVLYDQDMNMVDKVEQDYMPDDRLINVDIYSYPEYSYLMYQYVRRNVVYFMAAKIDVRGKIVGEPMELDTTQLTFAANNRVYNSIASEDKSKIMVFKINSKNKNNFLVTTLLYNDQLESIKFSRMPVPMNDRNDYLDEFKLDNEGNMVFAKFNRGNNDNINAVTLVMKPAMADMFTFQDIGLQNTYLDQLFIKVDNFNNRYFLTSFYYQQKRGNIEGMYFYVWDNKTGQVSLDKKLEFGDELRTEARGNSGNRNAFDNYFIRNIIIKKNGGFLLSAESYYTTSRGGVFNRWDYLYGMPYFYPYDNFYYSPFNYGFNSWWWRNRSMNQQVRHHAENIVVLSFDNKGTLEWNNVIKKEQFDDESDNTVSYLLANTGGELHFIYNSMEKRAVLLTDHILVPGGRITRNSALKNIDRGYSFMPKYAKQVSSQQVLIPCLYRNYICFAKVEL